MPGEIAQVDIENADGEATADDAGGRRRRIAAIAAAGVLVLAGAGYGAAYSLGMFTTAEQARTAPTYFDLPEMTVNLSSVNQRSQYLRLRVALEMDEARTRAAIEPVLPRVLDTFQVYLRELRATDLEGSAGLYRLKEELVRRVNMSIYPAEITGVVFKEIIVQ